MDWAIKKLLFAQKRLEETQSRISRRNARRAVLGAIKRVRNAMDNEFPTISKPQPPKEAIDRQAAAAKAKATREANIVKKVKSDSRHLTWRDFEKKYIFKTPEWSGQRARDFNEYFCNLHEIKPKPLKWCERRTGWLGQHPHAEDAPIMIGVSDRNNSWGIVFHEVAHYREKNHNHKVKHEFYDVFQVFKKFIKEKR